MARRKLGKDAAGRFVKGNAGGPGRTSRRPPAKPDVAPPLIGDDAWLTLEASARAAVDTAWLKIEGTYHRASVVAMARDAIAAGQWVPDRIRELVSKARPGKPHRTNRKRPPNKFERRHSADS